MTQTPDDESTSRSDPTPPGSADHSTGWLEPGECIVSSVGNLYGDSCPMRNARHRHRTDGSPEPAVASTPHVLLGDRIEQMVGALPDDLVEPAIPRPQYWDRGYVESFIRGELRPAEMPAVRQHVAALLGDVNRLQVGLAVIEGKLADALAEMERNRS